MNLDLYLSREIQMMIWEYKHSGEMYDVAQQFKQWFPFHDVTTQNLYRVNAFNYRHNRHNNFNIYNIFQECAVAVAELPLRMIKEFNIRDNSWKIDSYDEEFHIPVTGTIINNNKLNWRQIYMDTFHL